MLSENTQCVLLCVILLAGLGSIAVAVVHGPIVKWLESAGLLFDVAGVIQLRLAGFFDMVLEKYGDVDQYPYGPPSHITRRIIDDPDRPVKTWFRNTLFIESRRVFG
jgi:hypothetical protein